VYRSRPKGRLQNDASELLSSVSEDSQIFYYDVLGSQAHSLMLYDIGILSHSELRKILEPLEEIRKQGNFISSSEKYPSVNEFEDIHEFLEGYVIEHAGIEAGGKMHTARSRNDQIMVDIRMKARDQINEICIAIVNLIDSLLSRALEHTDTTIIMYTHMQHAQIGTFSHFLMSYVESLFRDIDRFYVTYGRVNQSPLGACAIGGSSIQIDRHRTAVLLGFNSIVHNSIDATSSRDTLIEFIFSITVMMTTLSRIAEDFIIWSTSEFSYIEISDEYSSTSSAMPQKKNPDPLEVIRSKTSLLLGNLVSMVSTVKGLPSGYSRDLQDLKLSVWQSSDVALQCLRVMNNIIKSITVYTERMKQNAVASYAISVDIAEQLVTKKKMPFRLAHQFIGGLVQKAASKSNRPLAMLDEKDVSNSLENMNFALDVAEVMQIIRETTPEVAIRMRTSLGSPNPIEEEEAIRTSYRKLSGYREGIAKRKKSIETAFDNLLITVQEHLENKEG
jgi:argininosuccinate lyase